MTDRIGHTEGKQARHAVASGLRFERLWAPALGRQQGENWRLATRNLPGPTLARRALSRADEPLSPSNFLKGQAINGPFGVSARLAEHVGAGDEDGRWGRAGEDLPPAWAAHQQRCRLLDEDNRKSKGPKWRQRYVRATADSRTERRWMSGAWSGWRHLAGRLRPDTIGKQERRVLRPLRDSKPIRARCPEILRRPEVVRLFRETQARSRGQREQTVLIVGDVVWQRPAQPPDDPSRATSQWPGFLLGRATREALARSRLTRTGASRSLGRGPSAWRHHLARGASSCSRGKLDSGNTRRFASASMRTRAACTLPVRGWAVRDRMDGIHEGFRPVSVISRVTHFLGPAVSPAARFSFELSRGSPEARRDRARPISTKPSE